VSLFAQQLCVDEPCADLVVPGRFDETLGLRVDDAGRPIAAALLMPTRADRDRPDQNLLITTVTKAMSDRDESPSLADDHSLLGTKTAAGADRDDDRFLISTVTFSGPDRDD